MRVPAKRTNIEISSNCEEICFSAFLYEKKIPDDVAQTCGKFTAIIIPKNVLKINDTKYTTSQIYYSKNGSNYRKVEISGGYQYNPILKRNENSNLTITMKDSSMDNNSILLIKKYFDKATIVK